MTTGSERSYPVRPILAVSTAVVRNGRVLVAARANAPGRGLYSLPGGLVELGETLHEAAARELLEEVGVVAEPIGLCGTRDIIVRDGSGKVERHFVVVSFAAGWISGEGTPSPEALDVRWVTPDDLEGLPSTEGLIVPIRAALALVGRT